MSQNTHLQLTMKPRALTTRLTQLSMKTLICMLTIMLSAMTFVHAESPSKTPATDFLKLKIAEVMKLAAVPTPNARRKAELDAKLLKIIKPLMDFSTMSRQSLGKHWAARTPAERARFIALFQELVFHSYMKKIRSARSGYKLEYEDESPRANKGAVVEAISITESSETELRFVLKSDGRGGYIAEDIVIEEVSLVQNYREQFNRIITKSGFKALLEKMERQIAKVK